MSNNYTKAQQVNLCMAYLAYSGQNLVGKSVPARILHLINESMPNIPPLLDSKGDVDWIVVWGPATYTFKHAILQDNMMFVAQQKSEPTNYIVATRGTNAFAALDWLEEDFEVWKKVKWPLPVGTTFDGTPEISKATQTGYEILLKMQPPEDVPGQGKTITKFLQSLVQSGPVNIQFTGHSLAGALAPSLALWFKQSQNIADQWDPQGNASISTIPFAGATPGNEDFSQYFGQYFNEKLGVCDRIHNTLDIVPHAWETATLLELPKLYVPTNKMTLPEKLFWATIETCITGYKQIPQSNPFTWEIQTDIKSYLGQALHQHVDSYPHQLGVPKLLDQGVINLGSDIELCLGMSLMCYRLCKTSVPTTF